MYYEPYQKRIIDKFINYDKFKSKPWNKRKGGFKRANEEKPPNTVWTFFN